MQKYEYKPDHLVTPGQTLKYFLKAIGMTQVELSDRTGISRKTINEIINGRSPLTHETAKKFEFVLGHPAKFWNKLESDYQEDIIRLKEKTELQNYLSWLDEFPIEEMIKNKWISCFEDKIEQLKELFRFYSITSPAQWHKVWNKQLGIECRHAARFEKNAESVSAWLRQGEIEAGKITTQEYNKEKFMEILNIIRIKLTAKTDPDNFIPILTELCAVAGVAVVFVPELPLSGVPGATYWINNKEKAIIQLCLIYKTNDNLWFTFFHEAAHIILHGKSEFIEKEIFDIEKEKQADNFARNMLIPQHEMKQFLETTKQITVKNIKAFSKKISVAPGIVVGRLQHDGIIAKDFANELKIIYSWLIQ